jgi:hypothetical protein
MLGPGRYRLEGSHKGEVIGLRGLRWRVVCADGGSTLGESILFNGLVPSWKEFAFGFEIPPAGCRAQYVRLALDARSASERFISGSIWYDELRIVSDDAERDGEADARN